ncbi:MAG: hypothetical protein ABR585_05595 [Gemmatimonadaceae bacterium]
MSLRQLLLALVLVGIVGLAVELALLRHAESVSQWIPHVTLFVGLLVTLAVYFRPRRKTLKAFRIVMAWFIVIGVLGLYFHFKGNVEFALERNPSLTGLPLVWKALRGATPALAPGALSQLGLLGLVFTFRHPGLTEGDVQDRENAV